MQSMFPDTPASSSTSSRGLGGDPASSTGALSDSRRLVSSSLPCYTSSSSSSSGSSSDGSSDGSSSQQHSIFQPTADDDAVIAASNRISRFMDFRERCASEVVGKLVELGYEKQLAYKVLERMQDTVSGTKTGLAATNDGTGCCQGVAAHMPRWTSGLVDLSPV
jgi:hypothetical protein